ncbi:hypothetical protein PE067_17235 [Paracoccus sp. DMF-8]|uniref:hypothetical protein n=1 Tax=Paracoccus sp. DMF-8 TaxID=3019445 RepID=UPI0023E389A5|nr:hypothetical protein [Paracoccus sp. DMF-8]MDF3607729.1 hypothetical protein [Paracoccus sp. DMF-8]
MILRSLRLRFLASLGIGAAILTSWWLRVEDARAPKELPQIGLGQAVAAGRTSLIPERLMVQDGQLILEATVETMTGATVGTPFGAPARLPDLLLENGPLPAAEVILLRDGEPLRQLHPRMPEQVRLIWPPDSLPPDHLPPEMTTIRFSRQIFKLRDNLYGQASWLGHEPSGELRITPEVLP